MVEEEELLLEEDWPWPGLLFFVAGVLAAVRSGWLPCRSSTSARLASSPTARRLRPTFFSSWFILTILNSCSSLTWSSVCLPNVVDRLGDVAEAFDAFGDFDKGAELRGTQDLALDDVADAVLGEEGIPDVGLELLDAKGEPAVFGFDAEDDGADLFTLLQDTSDWGA